MKSKPVKISSKPNSQLKKLELSSGHWGLNVNWKVIRHGHSRWFQKQNLSDILKNVSEQIAFFPSHHVLFTSKYCCITWLEFFTVYLSNSKIKQIIYMFKCIKHLNTAP